MSFVPRKEEIAQVAAAIEDCQTLEEVAKVALKASFKVIQRRTLWGVAVRASHSFYSPFASEADAYSALAGNKIEDFTPTEDIKAIRKGGAVPTLGGEAAVIQMTGPLLQQDRAEAIDLEAHRAANRLCVTCDHPLAAHGLTPRNPGCAMSGCSCPAPKKP